LTAVSVPGLGEKLRLLAQLADVGGWDGLAQLFERKEQTLRYWGLGNAARPPDMLPSEHLPTLRKAIADAIKEDPASAHIDELINGSPGQLHQVLLGRSGHALRDVIESLGEPAHAALVVGRSSSIELVRVERVPPKPVDLKVALDIPFRLVFSDVHRRPVTLILQKSPSAWGYLGAGSRDGKGDLHVPGQSSTGFATMVEGTEIGIHRFVVIGLSAEPSVNLSRYLRNEIALDLSAVSAIAASLQKTEKTKGSVSYCDILIQRS
jgi:hypothetical protein